MRDKNTGRFIKNVENVTGNTVKNTEDFMYYSKLLNKPFASLEEMRAEENKVKAEQEKKNKETEARKSEADIVKQAYKDYLDADELADKEIAAARAEFVKDKAAAEKKYAEALKEANKKVQVAKERYEASLSNFNKQYPEGFHMSIKDGEVTITPNTKAYDDLIDEIFEEFMMPFVSIFEK